MEAFEIWGPCSLDGEIQISGAKNAALPILFASLMCRQDVFIKGIPKVVDIATTLRLFRQMGVASKMQKSGVHLSPQKLSDVVAPYELVSRMRASILCLGPLLARYGEVSVSFPGGCAIGTRPIDFHLAALRKMGAELDVKEGYVTAKATRLVGETIVFPRKTVTGTANVLCAAVLARGKTVLKNAACEPELVDLCCFLRKVGAKIHGDGSSQITIEGVSRLRGSEFEVMKDRIEWGTYVIAAAAMESDVSIHGDVARFGRGIVRRLRQAGVDIVCRPKDGVTMVKGTGRLEPISISTGPFPRFATDLQAQWMALMTQASGTAMVVENVFENRFMHVGELQRMGAQVELHHPRRAVIKGTPKALTGAEVMATDLRASASLVIAAMTAQGKSVIHRIYHLDRGYERMDDKLAKLGVTIRRMQQTA